MSFSSFVFHQCAASCRLYPANHRAYHTCKIRHITQWSISLKTLSREDTPPGRTQILRSNHHECMWYSLSPNDTSLIRTELFGRRGVPIRGGLLYILCFLVCECRTYRPACRSSSWWAEDRIRYTGPHSPYTWWWGSGQPQSGQSPTWLGKKNYTCSNQLHLWLNLKIYKPMWTQYNLLQSWCHRHAWNILSFGIWSFLSMAKNTHRYRLLIHTLHYLNPDQNWKFL